MSLLVLFVPSLSLPQYQVVLPTLPTIQPIGFFASISRFFANLFGIGGSVDVSINGVDSSVGIGGYPGGYAGGYPGGYGVAGGIGGYGGVPQIGFGGGVNQGVGGVVPGTIGVDKRIVFLV